MKTISIDFSIHSMDSNQEFSTRGEQVDNEITFKDPIGDQNVINIDESILIYQKIGTSNLYFVFDLENPTEGTYKVYDHEFIFSVNTTKLTIESGHIYVEYQLYQSNELVNKTSLELFYSE